MGRKSIDFDDDAVDFVRQIFPFGCDFFRECPDFFDRIKESAFRIGPQTDLRQSVQQCVLCLHSQLFEIGCVVQIDIQVAAGRNTRVQLAQTAGSGIARIRKNLQAFLITIRIQLDEGRFRHVAFAADFESQRFIQTQRNGFDRPQVLRDVFADISVTSRRALDKQAVFVFQRYG